MGITVSWDDERKTRFHWKFESQWTWKQYYDAMHISSGLAREVDYPIDVIVDLQASSIIPSHVLSNVRAETGDQPEKLGTIIVVGANAFVNALLNILGRINRRLERKIHTARTLEEARTLLDQRRAEEIRIVSEH